MFCFTRVNGVCWLTLPILVAIPVFNFVTVDLIGFMVHKLCLCGFAVLFFFKALSQIIYDWSWYLIVYGCSCHEEEMIGISCWHICVP